ncbi:MAG: ABC transporter ATP-binding protein [Thermoleophilia bacterium]|nr:ABC transporter ATP-binding protein [Thermoleophilia bacterium]
MLLEIKDLWVHYGSAEALRGVSLSVDEGEIVTLLGANGAGKTTTLRTISGLKKATSGEIWYRGERIDGLPAHERVKQGIAHVPEGRQLFYTLSVQQNLQMGGYLWKNRTENKSRLDELCEHFPALRQRLHHQASDLSGGEQQMVAVARALMARPKVLLMDEPSLGLSPIMVQEVANIVRQIHDSGVAVVLVEQNARMALKLAERAYVLEVGSVTVSGEASAVAKDDTVTRAYLGY